MFICGQSRRLSTGRLAPLACALALAGVCAPGPSARGGSAQEVYFSNKEFEKLDTFEAHRLSKADKMFNKKDYRRASAEYETFIKEFPNSLAVGYAVLRMARSLHLQHKRFQAVKVYNEVIDYFPNAVAYAGSALYFIGQCHWENGDEAKAMKAWAEMADDVDYSKHFLAASAINRLAENLAKQGKADAAVKYFRQVALDFRKSNPRAAKQAIDKVVYHFVRAAPNEPKLRDFYEKAKTFHERSRRIDGKTEEDRQYWGSVRGSVKHHGRFEKDETGLKRRYYTYWAGVMEGRLRDWDDYQIDIASFRRSADGDVSKWMERIDAQFERGGAPGDYARVVRWISLYRDHKTRMMEYYAKLDFEKMKNADIRRLMGILYGAGKHDMAKNAFGRIRFSEMSDGEKAGLAREVWRYEDRGLVETVCRSMEDEERGRMELLRYYHWRTDIEHGLPLADGLSGSPTYAKEAIWLKAELLHRKRKYKEAIAAYQQADRPPDNLWRIAECYTSLRDLSAAVAQLREVEGFFKDHSSEALLRIAHLYKKFKKRKEHVAALRELMKKYRKSKQSRTAHNELEALGVRIGGAIGVDERDERE